MNTFGISPSPPGERVGERASLRALRLRWFTAQAREQRKLREPASP